MSVSSDSAASVLSGLLAALGSLDPDRAIEYFDDDATFAFPYSPPGFPAIAQGRQEVLKMLRGMSMFETIELHDMQVHGTDDPELAFATFGSRAQLRNAGPYTNRYVSVVRVRDGRIIEYQEHFGPMALLAALPLRMRLPMLVLAALPPTASAWVAKRLRRLS